MSEPFTMERALDYQRQHLAEWASVLKPAFFARLHRWAMSKNKTCTDPNRVVRGEALACRVHNYAVGNYLDD